MRKPFFKKSHQAWYVHHQGRLQRLGPDKAEAFRRYHELMLSDAPQVDKSETVVSLLNAYLAWCEKNRAPLTYEFYRKMLSSFARSIGTQLRIDAIKPVHVTRWVENPNWNDTTRADAVRCVKRVFNWAIKQERLTVNPIRNVERPTPRRREAFVSRAQFLLIMEAASDECFREYLTFLYETGARPQEMPVIEAKHCDLNALRVVIPASQAKGKRFPRVIYFTKELAPMITRRCQEFPNGPLFRNRHGHPWDKCSINCRMRRLRAKLKKQGTPMDGLCATAFRHGFATEALKNGVDPVTVSILMGHSDASQVARTYQHLAADPVFLAKALERTKGHAE